MITIIGEKSTLGTNFFAITLRELLIHSRKKRTVLVAYDEHAPYLVHSVNFSVATSENDTWWDYRKASHIVPQVTQLRNCDLPMMIGIELPKEGKDYERRALLTRKVHLPDGRDVEMPIIFNAVFTQNVDVDHDLFYARRKTFRLSLGEDEHTATERMRCIVYQPGQRITWEDFQVDEFYGPEVEEKVKAKEEH